MKFIQSDAEILASIAIKANRLPDLATRHRYQALLRVEIAHQIKQLENARNVMDA